MPPQSPVLDAVVREALPRFQALSWHTKVFLVALAGLGLLAYFVIQHVPGLGTAASASALPAANPDGSANVFFAFWNVENLFDDHDDRGHRRPVDEAFDDPFAHDEKLRSEKYDHLAEALVRMNGGKGPDVICCAEVESVRAAELLQITLNKHLTDPKLKYTQVAMKNLDAGRHIAPCLITRLNVSHAQTKLHGRLLRILEVHLSANGHDLCVLATHWTSQLRQKDDSHGDGGRDKYARLIHERYAELVRKNPATDFLVCGDFNDTPESEPVRKALQTTDDPARLDPRAETPLLLDLMAGKEANKYGTIYYNKPLIYDQICVSPGMLDRDGWSCDPASIHTFTDGLIHRGDKQHRPWRFGDPKNAPTQGRGYSDHFPVTVQLRVAPPGGSAP